MNHLLRALLATAVVLAFATAGYGQPSWALPAKTPNTPVACTSCPNVAAGAMTVGYQGPVVTFAGRFLDSSNVRDYQATFRTARAWNVMVNEQTNRIYFRIGSSVFAYSLDTFFSRLESNEELMYSTRVPVNPPNARLDGTEVFLRWDEYFYPEYNNNVGWKTIKIDRQEFIESFDVDNEGYVYIPAEQLGWGIVKDAGTKAGGLMVSQFQRFLTSGDPVPYRIVAVRGSGGRMIAIVSGPTTDSDVWDVTNRRSPVKLADRPEAIRSWAKNRSGDIAAMIDWGSTLRIMNGDQLASNGAPLFTGNNYLRVTSDGTNFYALKLTPTGGRIAVIVPSGAGYVEYNTYPVDPTFQVTLDTKMNFGGGHIFLAGADTSYVWDARVYKMNNLTPTLVPILAHPTGTSYFKTYYAQGTGGYVAPGGPYINMSDGTVVQRNGKTYLIVCVKGLGDVYQIGGPVTTPPPTPPPTTPPPTTPPPTGGCAMMNANSWQVVYEGTASRCSNGLPCQAGEQITYRADAPLYGGYDPSCATHTFTWTFPNGLAGTGNPTTTIFTGAGTARVRIQNAFGGAYEYTVYVSGGSTTPPPTNPPPTTPPTSPPVPPAGCGLARPGIELWVDYTNANRTCGPLGGRCNAAEPVNFSVKDYAPYNMSCAQHSFEWDFGDGSPRVTGGRDVSHTYNTAGDYALKVRVNNTYTTIEIPMTVGIAAPIPALPEVKADVAASAVSGEALMYTFVAKFSPADSVKEWYWNFGDGSPERKGSGTPANPLPEFYQYAQAGTYTVTLRMIDTLNRELPPYRETLTQAVASPLTGSRRRATRP